MESGKGLRRDLDQRVVEGPAYEEDVLHSQKEKGCQHRCLCGLRIRTLHLVGGSRGEVQAVALRGRVIVGHQQAALEGLEEDAAAVLCPRGLEQCVSGGQGCMAAEIHLRRGCEP